MATAMRGKEKISDGMAGNGPEAHSKGIDKPG